MPSNNNNFENIYFVLESDRYELPSMESIREIVIDKAYNEVQDELIEISKGGILDIGSSNITGNEAIVGLKKSYIEVGKALSDYFIERMAISMTIDIMSAIANAKAGASPFNVGIDILEKGTMKGKTPIGDFIFSGQDFGKQLGKFFEPTFFGLPIGGRVATSDITNTFTELKITSAEDKFKDMIVGNFSLEVYGKNTEITEEVRAIAALYKIWNKVGNLLQFKVDKYTPVDAQMQKGQTKKNIHAIKYFPLFPKTVGVSKSEGGYLFRPIKITEMALYMGLLFQKLFKSLFKKSEETLTLSAGNSLIKLSGGSAKGLTQNPVMKERNGEVFKTHLAFNTSILMKTITGTYSLLELYAMRANLLDKLVNLSRENKINFAKNFTKLVSGYTTIEDLNAAFNNQMTTAGGSVMDALKRIAGR